MTEWELIRIPQGLKKEADNIVKKHPELGYTNSHELIRDSIREKIVAIKRNHYQPLKKGSVD